MKSKYFLEIRHNDDDDFFIIIVSYGNFYKFMKYLLIREKIVINYWMNLLN